MDKMQKYDPEKLMKLYCPEAEEELSNKNLRNTVFKNMEFLCKDEWGNTCKAVTGDVRMGLYNHLGKDNYIPVDTEEFESLAKLPFAKASLMADISCENGKSEMYGKKVPSHYEKIEFFSELPWRLYIKNQNTLCVKIFGEEDTFAVIEISTQDKKSFDTIGYWLAYASKISGEKYEEEQHDYYQELEDLVGLAEVKEEVLKMASLSKVNKYRKLRGLRGVPVSKHLLFTGNPGTGKTTVARILGGIYKDMGILSKGHVVEVDREGLVAQYTGQTANKTAEKCKEAEGGILFIDEAYSLVSKYSNDFGHEAIETILKAMEDNREDFMVIAAGYNDEMECFVNSNPGFQSRFRKKIWFRDYSEEELMEIFSQYCKQYGFYLTVDAQKAVQERIHVMIAGKEENFANAREVRNYFENIYIRQSNRIAAMQDPKPEDLSVICRQDVV